MNDEYFRMRKMFVCVSLCVCTVNYMRVCLVIEVCKEVESKCVHMERCPDVGQVEVHTHG